MNDPLAGWRRKIADFETSLIRYPADEECPVNKGQIFHLRGCTIVIESIKRKLIPGKTPEWHVTFSRREQDKVYLLRQSPPVHASSEDDQNINISAQERARRDGQYTSSSVSAIPLEPESVGPEWKNPAAPENELKRQRDRMDIKREDEVRKATRHIKLDTARVIRETHSRGKDITHLLADIYERLAQQSEENKRAA